MIFWNFVLIFVLVALNAFFVSVEFAAVASRRTRDRAAGRGWQFSSENRQVLAGESRNA